MGWGLPKWMEWGYLGDREENLFPGAGPSYRCCEIFFYIWLCGSNSTRSSVNYGHAGQKIDR